MAANLSSIARPYALAAFESGKNAQQLPQWKAFLESASYMVKQPAILRLLDNPQVQNEKLFELFQGVLSTQLDTERTNFLRLVTQNKRLNTLAEVADYFNGLCAAYEKMSKVRVVTAIDIQDDFRQKLTQALTKRVNRDVSLQCEVDPSILGGAIIHIGDRVIDGSVRGKLTRLLEFSLR